jgi:DNA-binding XRE family transcriptional regulator
MTYTPKQARILHDFTQEDVANALKVHVQTYRKLEIDPDKFTIEQAKIFSEFVGMPCDQIFFN